MYFILDGSRDEKVLKEERHDPRLKGVVGRAQSKNLADSFTEEATNKKER